VCVLCIECNSILNHNLLPDRSFTLGGFNQLQNCTGTTEGECQSPKCLGIKYYHLQTKTFLPSKLGMLGYETSITSHYHRMHHHEHLGNVGKPLEILSTNYVIVSTAYLVFSAFQI
jgi:hypothetical protein